MLPVANATAFGFNLCSGVVYCRMVTLSWLYATSFVLSVLCRLTYGLAVCARIVGSERSQYSLWVVRQHTSIYAAVRFSMSTGYEDMCSERGMHLRCSVHLQRNADCEFNSTRVAPIFACRIALVHAFRITLGN